MKLFIFVVTMLLSSLSFAQINSRNISSDYDNLPEQTRLAIAKQIADAKAAQKPALPGVVETVAAVTPERLNEWAEKGKGIGMAIGSAAKELGIAANDFLKTDAGKMTMGIILWKMLGHDVTHFIGGFVFFFSLASIWVYIYRRTCLVSSITLTPIQLKVLGVEVTRNIKTTEYNQRPGDGEHFFLMVIGVAIILVSGVIIFVT